MDFLNDIRFTLRSLAKAPSFSAVVILTLALGIGANASIFSVVNAVLLNPLPIADADDVVLVSETIRRDIVERRSASYPDFLDWREQNQVFEEIVAFANGSFTITGDNGAERVEGELVTDGYFRLLRAAPALGRGFTPEENLAPETHPVAVISNALWLGRFGADPEIIGRPITIEERGFTVIGVAPAGFVGLDDDTDLWIPMMMAPIGLPLRFLENRSTRWLDVIARLHPGRTAEEAQTEMDAIAARLEAEYPDNNENRGALVLPIRAEVQGGLRGPLLVLLATVGFVLLIACANVGNLMLTRIAARERETAVRAALGAGRARLLRQFLTESVVLSGIGGLIGILVSLWMVEGLREFSPMGLPSYVDISVDGPVLLFTLLVAILTGVGIGAVATFYGSRPNLNEALKSGGRSGAGTAHQRLRSILVVSEVGLALLLLIGAGLMVESFSQMRSVETGFDADNLTKLRIGLPTIRYADEQVWPFGRQLLERIEALPSVTLAALTSDIPLEGSANATIVTPEDFPLDAERGVRVYVHRISPSFFETAGMTLLRGRNFDARDNSESTRSVIVSEKFAERLWPDDSPIDERIKFGDPDSNGAWMTIVGVVANAKYRALVEDPTEDPDDPDIFFSLAQYPIFDMGLLVRTSNPNPTGLTAALRREVQSLDSSVPIYAVAPMSQLVEQQTAGARFTALLMGLFGALALVLAAIGIYGIVSYSVAQRSREIGVRTALGAQRADVFRMVIGHALALTGAGIALGLGGALALTRLITSQLYGVSPTEPIVFVVMSAALLAVALLASYLPARRATRVDPLVCLRYE